MELLFTSDALRPTSRLALAASCALVLAACGGGGGGGGSTPGFSELVAPEVEPNNTAANAVELLVGQPGQGSLATPGDVDWWRIELARDELVQLEVFAVRADQVRWDDPSVKSIARVEVFHPDATTIWRAHDFQSNAPAGSPSFGHKPQDLDFSFLRAPLDGTYFVRLRPIAATPAGGGYVLRFRKAFFGAATRELESLGVIGLNDTAATAQPISPGALFGAQSVGDIDVYSFQVTSPVLASFDLHAERGGMLGGASDYLDMSLRLLDSDGSTELFCADNTHFADPRLEYAFATPGTYYVEVAQARGAVSGEYMLVHSLQPRSAAVFEVESNDSAVQAQAVALGVWLQGAVARGDEDWFTFVVDAGDMLEVQVLDGANADDLSGVAVPGLVRSDGTTALQGGGDWTGRRLSAIVPSGGPYYLQMTHDGEPSSYRFRIRVVRSATMELEPNDQAALAQVLALGGRYCGLLDDAADRDWYRVDAEAGKLVVLQCYAGWAINGGSGERGSWGSSVSPSLILYDDSPVPVELAESTVDVQFCSTEGIVELEPAAALAFISPVSATYYVRVHDSQSRASIDHAYVIERR